MSSLEETVEHIKELLGFFVKIPDFSKKNEKYVEVWNKVYIRRICVLKELIGDLENHRKDVINHYNKIRTKI